MRHKPAPDPERIAAIVTDADMLGVECACRKWKISRRTLVNYRARVRADAQTAQLCASKKSALGRTWLEATDAARHKILERVVELSSQSRDLHEVAGALKIVTDASVAERVVIDGLQSDGRLDQPSARTPGQSETATAIARAADRLEGAVH